MTIEKKGVIKTLEKNCQGSFLRIDSKVILSDSQWVESIFKKNKKLKELYKELEQTSHVGDKRYLVVNEFFRTRYPGAEIDTGHFSVDRDDDQTTVWLNGRMSSANFPPKEGFKTKRENTANQIKKDLKKVNIEILGEL